MLVGAYSSGHAVYMKVSSTPYLVFRIPYSVFLAALEALYLPLWNHCLTAKKNKKTKRQNKSLKW